MGRPPSLTPAQQKEAIRRRADLTAMAPKRCLRKPSCDAHSNACKRLPRLVHSGSQPANLAGEQLMTTTTVDLEAIRQKYAQERDKRLRPDGNNQYIRMTDEFAHYRADPHTPFVERPPVTDHVTFAFIGGGWAGLVTGARLKDAGVQDVRIIDRAGDFGGTWYWNRYPGAMCDTSSLVYMPLLEETNYMPTEKYAHGPEILEHCRAHRHAVRPLRHALFHTDVNRAPWHEDSRAGSSRTDRGDAFTAQFVAMGTGPAEPAKLPGMPGIEDFKATPSTPAAGTTTTPAATRRRADGQIERQARRDHRHRRHRGAGRARSRQDRAETSTFSSARRRRWTSATTARSTRNGSTTSLRPAGSGAGWRTSRLTPKPGAPSARRTRTWSRTAGRTLAGACGPRLPASRKRS